MVVAKPIDSSSKFFYKLNREALKATRENLWTKYSEFSFGQFQKYFPLALKEENFVIAYHKRLLNESFMDTVHALICITSASLFCYNALLSVFRGCGRKMLEDGTITSRQLQDLFWGYLSKPIEGKRIKLLFSQYDFAKLVFADPEKLSVYKSIPIDRIEQVNLETFNIVLDLINDGGNRENAIERVFPKQEQPYRNSCTIL